MPLREIFESSAMAKNGFKPSIVALSLRVPKYGVDQMQALRKCVGCMLENGEWKSTVSEEFLTRVYHATKIQRRHMFVADFIDHGAHQSQLKEHDVVDDTLSELMDNYGKIPIEKRLRLFANQVEELVLEACREALAGINVTTIGMVIVTSSTFISSPGVLHRVIREMGLRPDVQQLNIVFAGCGAGINAWRAANMFVRANPERKALFVCVESSSIHTTFEDSKNDAITHSLFADGALASVVEMQPMGLPGQLNALDECGVLVAGTEKGIKLSITGNGIRCDLDSHLKEFLVSAVSATVTRLLERSKLTSADIKHWAIHPGGPRIIEACEMAIGLTKEQTSASWEVLAEYGNMLSVAVFFVIDRLRRQQKKTPGSAPEKAIALAFSPGVTVEAVLFDL